VLRGTTGLGLCGLVCPSSTSDAFGHKLCGLSRNHELSGSRINFEAGGGREEDLPHSISRRNGLGSTRT
jgi:hypothetical protein